VKRLIVPIALSVWLAVASFGIADPTPPVKLAGERKIESLALEWFGRMLTGQIDRTQLTARYSAQLTSEMIEATSRHLKKYQYGASPLGAKILQSRVVGDQRFYVVEILFPRGDGASLLLGLNTDRKITGISLLSMAGD
jgi:hypothetical protein